MAFPAGIVQVRVALPPPVPDKNQTLVSFCPTPHFAPVSSAVDYICRY